MSAVELDEYSDMNILATGMEHDIDKSDLALVRQPLGLERGLDSSKDLSKS